MDCQLLVSENIFLKYVSNCLEIELEKIIKIGIDNTVHSERSEESPCLIIFLFCRTDIPVCFFSFFLILNLSLFYYSNLIYFI